MIANIAASISSLFNPPAAPPLPAPRSLSSESHADRCSVLAETKRDVADRLEARRADRAREDLADVAAANDAIARAEREASDARARCAGSISGQLLSQGAPVVADLRGRWTREESEALRRLVLAVDGRCRAELNEPLRHSAIGYLVAGERRPHAIEGAAVASQPGARASAVLGSMALPGAFHDALRDLDRAIEAALPESDLEAWAELSALVVESDSMRALAALRRRRSGAAS